MEEKELLIKLRILGKILPFPKSLENPYSPCSGEMK